MLIMSLKHKCPNAPGKEYSFIYLSNKIYIYPSRGQLGPLPQFNEAPSPNNAPDQDMSTFGYSSIHPQQNIYAFNGWFGVLQNSPESQGYFRNHADYTLQSQSVDPYIANNPWLNDLSSQPLTSCRPLYRQRVSA